MPLLKELACGGYIADAEFYFAVIALDSGRRRHGAVDPYESKTAKLQLTP